jgi:hypothetical protein
MKELSFSGSLILVAISISACGGAEGDDDDGSGESESVSTCCDCACEYESAGYSCDATSMVESDTELDCDATCQEACEKADCPQAVKAEHCIPFCTPGKGCDCGDTMGEGICEENGLLCKCQLPAPDL